MEATSLLCLTYCQILQQTTLPISGTVHRPTTNAGLQRLLPSTVSAIAGYCSQQPSVSQVQYTQYTDPLLMEATLLLCLTYCQILQQTTLPISGTVHRPSTQTHCRCRLTEATSLHYLNSCRYCSQQLSVSQVQYTQYTDPLLMPAYRGYFAPLSQLLLDTAANNPPYLRYEGLRPHSHRTRKQICTQMSAKPLMLLATYVNTPIHCSVFHNLHARVARCSASCVNGALFLYSLVPNFSCNFQSMNRYAPPTQGA